MKKKKSLYKYICKNKVCSYPCKLEFKDAEGADHPMLCPFNGDAKWESKTIEEIDET